MKMEVRFVWEGEREKENRENSEWMGRRWRRRKQRFGNFVCPNFEFFLLFLVGVPAVKSLAPKKEPELTLANRTF